MKKIILVSMISTLVSCSVIERNPASTSLCMETLKEFFVPSRDGADLLFLNDKVIVDFLSKQKVEKKEIETDLLLIKKKYQHMNADQVIGHFKLLRNSCEQM